jgi:hypothetical protein
MCRRLAASGRFLDVLDLAVPDLIALFSKIADDRIDDDLSAPD